MRFRDLRRRRRRPGRPMFLLELQLPYTEVLADLAFPWADPATDWDLGERDRNG